MSSAILAGPAGDPDWLRKIIAIVAKVLPRPQPEAFGARLRRLRSARGLTQRELGERVRLSQRMVAYYETQGGTPSAPLVAEIAKLLRVSVDELVGGSKRATSPSPAPSSGAELRLWRRFKQLQTLPPQKQRTVLQVLDDALAATGRPVADGQGD